jgi:hypothetical protein
LPQVPQFAGSRRRSVQLAPHWRSGGVHIPAWQVPNWQTSPVPQRLPQAPQLFGSVSGLTHVPPQRAKGNVQVSMQVPSAHAAPGGQARPQPPQFAGSVWVLTHAPLQLVSGGVHIARQAPA